MVQVYVDNLNVNLNRWEQIKKFTILDHDLTIEDGDLTPSMKLRRKAVSEKYQEHAGRALHRLDVPGRPGTHATGGSATRGTKRYHPCSSTAGPPSACPHPQHPPGHRDDQHPAGGELVDQLGGQRGRLRRHQDAVVGAACGAGPADAGHGRARRAPTAYRRRRGWRRRR